ncbi:MAG: 5-methyltetrahydrofolate--homocysteine methyltransferase [Pseudohongiellaceae bacterium]|jgi:5-methyltetrahydrofolate--homocysteine methyltransferase
MATTTLEALNAIMTERVMILDGAMGTMIQRHPLEEHDFRGEAFKDHPSPLKGDNDLLSITRPQIIEDIHCAYFEAGADFATSNSFNGTTIAQADYGLEAAVYDINFHAAQCARRACDKWSAKTPDQPRFVIGAIGPTSRTCSLSPDVNDPGMRLVTFDELRIAYKQAANALLDGGADILMIETVFDSLNAKAALFAVDEVLEERGKVPVMVSGTITDASGRTLSGQTPEAFYVSMAHADLFSIGLNCALGADDLLPYIKRIDAQSTVFVSAHPNAGLPNEFGEYDQTPELMVDQLEPFVKGQHLNILGGCCGTTPEHISAIKALADRHKPRRS